MLLSHLLKLTVFHSFLKVSCFVLFSLLPYGITFCIFFPSYFLLMDAILETLFGSGFSKNTSRRCRMQFGFLKVILLLSSLGSWHNSSGYPSITSNHFSLLWPCVLLGITSKQSKSAVGSLPLIFLLFYNHQSSNAFSESFSRIYSSTLFWKFLKIVFLHSQIAGALGVDVTQDHI